MALPWQEKCWLLFAFPASGVVRLMIVSLPFNIYSRFLGHYYRNFLLSSLVSQEQLRLAWRIGRIIESVCKYTPWKSKCFVQAVLARILLGMYNIPYVLHMGTRLTGMPDQPMKAHVWVKVGPWIIVGREGHRAYPVVATFLSPPTTSSTPC
ncbi:lasso peptide biosynthesis B2 protein [Teredinibacter sp. KSP-S5-2]|uniref:lasso peptide biosynthesis B2 protein n=1 Tax=Teredinibacter sp. KSP-S5-2 TaxID=3034506 RepID=UPI003977B58A